jgi:hypothetical protein
VISRTGLVVISVRSVRGSVLGERFDVTGRAWGWRGRCVKSRTLRAAAMETFEGTRIVASGGRDLTPAQRAALGAGEVAGKQKGAHAEVTAIDTASNLGLSPSALVATRDFCPSCAKAIEAIGGVIVDARTAIWK